MVAMGNEEENPFLRATSLSEPIATTFERSAFSATSDDEKYWYVYAFFCISTIVGPNNVGGFPYFLSTKRLCLYVVGVT